MVGPTTTECKNERTKLGMCLIHFRKQPEAAHNPKLQEAHGGKPRISLGFHGWAPKGVLQCRVDKSLHSVSKCPPDPPPSAEHLTCRSHLHPQQHNGKATGITSTSWQGKARLRGGTRPLSSASTAHMRQRHFKAVCLTPPSRLPTPGPHRKHP